MLDPRLTRPRNNSDFGRVQQTTVDITPGLAVYSALVPFDKACTVVHATITADDEFLPDTNNPMLGGGAIYRLIGDGTHSPSFDATFKKSNASGNYDSTSGAINIVTFFFDGIDYWYSIIQSV